MTDFSISHPVSGAAVIAVSGPLNVVSAGSLRDSIRAAVAGGPNLRVVVDLSAVPTIDSSGLGALIGGLKATRSAGGDLRIAAASQQVMTALELTNLNRVLRPYPSVVESLADAATAPVPAANTGGPGR